MRFTGFKTKLFFTLGIYLLFWHRYVVKWLHDELNASCTEQETWRLFIPVYNWIVWWRYLALIRQVEAATFNHGFPSGLKPLSVARAFFWSSLWFSAGPYVNRHLNALDAFHRGQLSTAPPAPVAQPVP